MPATSQLPAGGGAQTAQQQANTQAIIGGKMSGAFSPASAATLAALTAKNSGAQPAGSPLPGTGPMQNPGNNLVNPGYSEQAFNLTQNRLLEDPFAGTMQSAATAAGTPSQGENYLNQNLGTLNGPGQGEQYWNQQQGQFNSPFQGEQFARQATQQMGASGPASQFNAQAQSQYSDFTGFQGTGNAQGQFQQNAQGGPLAGQQFYDSVAGQAGTTGRYTDPNLAARQYQQTQEAFGDLPIANFDPFYDRASQLGVQNYNRQAAGRGVYGSSEALSGVGNVITDIEAQRANRSFDAEMQRAQEQRARQGLLGEQARAGDLSSLSAFGANLSGLETFGGLANAAGNQTLGQQTMLGNQANMADSQALGVQQANISGLNAMGNIAGQADTSETNRFTARTQAMNNADRTALDRVGLGADLAFRTDDTNRADYATEAGVANNAAQLGLDRARTQAGIASQGSAQDLARLNSFNNQAQGAEGQRQERQNSAIRASENTQKIMSDIMSQGLDKVFAQDQQAFEDYFQATIVPALQAKGMSDAEIARERQNMQGIFQGGVTTADRAIDRM
jgi:hypothetical protein